MRAPVSVAALLAASAALGGCAGRTAIDSSAARAAAVLPPRVEESSLPLEEIEAIPEPGAPARTPAAAPAEALAGFRVQIFASPDRTTAETVAARARAVLGDPVYVEHEPPLFKVRVGDYLTRDEAARMREKALESAYADAWTVEARVNRRGAGGR